MLPTCWQLSQPSLLIIEDLGRGCWSSVGSCSGCKNLPCLRTEPELSHLEELSLSDADLSLIFFVFVVGGGRVLFDSFGIRRNCGGFGVHSQTFLPNMSREQGIEIGGGWRGGNRSGGGAHSSLGWASRG